MHSQPKLLLEATPPHAIQIAATETCEAEGHWAKVGRHLVQGLEWSISGARSWRNTATPQDGRVLIHRFRKNVAIFVIGYRECFYAPATNAFSDDFGCQQAAILGRCHQGRRQDQPHFSAWMEPSPPANQHQCSNNQATSSRVHPCWSAFPRKAHGVKDRLACEL